MANAELSEVESKYDVAADAVVPDLADLPDVTVVTPAVEQLREAVCFDTADRALVRAGVTVQRRVGGPDAGWHLATLGSSMPDVELRLPLSAGTDAVPTELLERVRGVAIGRPVGVAVVVLVRRSVRSLLDADGIVLAEVRDDQISARAPGDDGPRSWREWEVVPVAGRADVVRAVRTRLEEARAWPAAHRSTLERALGVGFAGTRTATSQRAPRGPAYVRGLVAGQLAELLAADLAVRSGAPGAVHASRIAARRLRSTLVSFGDVLADAMPDRALDPACEPVPDLGADPASAPEPEPEPDQFPDQNRDEARADAGVSGAGCQPSVPAAGFSARALRDELAWFGGELSMARDAQVMSARITARLDDELSRFVVGPVRERVATELADAVRRGTDQTSRALASDRYVDLLAVLTELAGRESASIGPSARRLARSAVRSDVERLRSAIRAAGDVPDAGAERDAALHEARKKAKRVRYTAESVTPVLGRPARRLAQAARELQDVLGEHHDSVVARTYLFALARRARRHGEDSFTYGRLHAREDDVALGLERRYGSACRVVVRVARELSD